MFMRFKDFEIRPCGEWNGRHHNFELVKWYKTNTPVEVINVETEEKVFRSEFCYVVAWIDYNDREPCWEFKSVGMRFIDDYVEGLCDYIKQFLNLIDTINNTVSEES